LELSDSQFLDKETVDKTSEIWQLIHKEFISYGNTIKVLNDLTCLRFSF
jgi:hypothetical protein